MQEVVHRDEISQLLTYGEGLISFALLSYLPGRRDVKSICVCKVTGARCGCEGEFESSFKGTKA